MGVPDKIWLDLMGANGCWTPDESDKEEGEDAYLLSTPAREHADELVEALEDAGRKLLSYVGVCKGDKELTQAILPKIHSTLSKIQGESE